MTEIHNNSNALLLILVSANTSYFMAKKSYHLSFFHLLAMHSSSYQTTKMSPKIVYVTLNELENPVSRAGKNHAFAPSFLVHR